MLHKDQTTQTGCISDDDRLSLSGPLSESWLRSRHYGLNRSDDHVPFIRPTLLKEVRGKTVGLRSSRGR